MKKEAVLAGLCLVILAISLWNLGIFNLVWYPIANWLQSLGCPEWLGALTFIALVGFGVWSIMILLIKTSER